METNTIMVFLKYKDRNSKCGKEILSKGSILYAGYKARQIDGKKDRLWNDIMVSEYECEDIYKETLENLADDIGLKYYKVLLVSHYSQDRTKSIVKEVSESSINSNVNSKKDPTVVIVNLLEYVKDANYTKSKDGKKPISGREAYKEYGRGFIKVVGKFGGNLEIGGKVKSTIVGKEEPNWDAYTFVRYPSITNLFEMVSTNQYKDSAKHRTAGLKLSNVYKTKPYKEFL